MLWFQEIGIVERFIAPAGNMTYRCPEAVAQRFACEELRCEPGIGIGGVLCFYAVFGPGKQCQDGLCCLVNAICFPTHFGASRFCFDGEMKIVEGIT